MTIQKISPEYAIINSKHISFDPETDLLSEQKNPTIFNFNEISAEIYDKLFNLAKKDGGHNNFLTAVNVNLDITAPLYWWKQADRYHWFQVTGSASTMHSIMKREIKKTDFARPEFINAMALDDLNELRTAKEFEQVIHNLPDGYLQRRLVSTNYLQLRNMYNQRKCHRLDEWKYFCKWLVLNLEYFREVV